MKAGDWVRFCRDASRVTKNNGLLEDVKFPIDWKEGLLVEYHTWEKVARILYDGKIISMHASDVQLARRAPEEI